MSSYKSLLLLTLLLVLMAFHVAWCEGHRWFYTIGLQFLLPYVRPTAAPMRRCAANETFRVMGKPCGKSCGTYGQDCAIERINRCTCLVGYARNQTGACIYHLDCPLNLDYAEFLDLIK